MLWSFSEPQLGFIHVPARPSTLPFDPPYASALRRPYRRWRAETYPPQTAYFHDLLPPRGPGRRPRAHTLG